MSRNIINILFFLILLLPCGLQAVVQPKIMVVPFVKENENIRTILEEDPNKRIIITKIKEAFDAHGFTTVDFIGKLKSQSIQNMLESESNQQQDVKSLIISNSGADIYVDSEMIVTYSQSGNSVKVIVTAYEVSTGNSLANTVGESGKFYTEDFGRLGAKAIGSCADDFMKVMQSKFEEIAENGRAISLNIGFADNSEFDMNTEIGDDGLTLADHIELWLSENTYKGNYHIIGTTAKKMQIDDLKIPLKDPNGTTYNINKFSLEFLKFTRRLGLKISRDITSNSLIVTVQ